MNFLYIFHTYQLKKVFFLCSEMNMGDHGREASLEKKEIDERRDDDDDDVEENINEYQVTDTNRPWTKQLTVRGVLASIVIGSIYSIIAMKLNLTTGMVPNFNVSAALLAFVFIRTWNKVVQKFGYIARPFTRQENTMIQTCAVACYSIAVGG